MNRIPENYILESTDDFARCVALEVPVEVLNKEDASTQIIGLVQGYSDHIVQINNQQYDRNEFLFVTKPFHKE